MEIGSAGISFRSWINQLFQNPKLIWVMASRDVHATFINLKLGKWALALRPLIPVILYWLVFTFIFKFKASTEPYFIFLFSGMLVWQLFYQTFQSVLGIAKHDIILIKKTKLRLHTLCLAKVFLPVMEVFITLLLFLGFYFFVFHYSLTLNLLGLLLPFTIALVVGIALGNIAVFLTVKWPDLEIIIQPGVGFFIWLSPVFYAETMVPIAFQNYFNLNPIATAINFNRHLLFNHQATPLLLPFVVSLLVFGFSFFLIYKAELAIRKTQ